MVTKYYIFDVASPGADSENLLHPVNEHKFLTFLSLFGIYN